jgi:hypothetical protein
MQAEYLQLSETFRSNENKLYNIISENDQLRKRSETIESERLSEYQRQSAEYSKTIEVNEYKIRMFE